MTLEDKVAKVFNLTDDNWMKHANPFSVWSRYSALSLITIAFWSRIWDSMVVPCTDNLVVSLDVFQSGALFKTKIHEQLGIQIGIRRASLEK